MWDLYVLNIEFLTKSMASHVILPSLLLTQLFIFFGLSSGSNVYIVYMGEKTKEEPKLVQELHHGILSAVLGRVCCCADANSSE